MTPVLVLSWTLDLIKATTVILEVPNFKNADPAKAVLRTPRERKRTCPKSVD
jgi:hypothetical protein